MPNRKQKLDINSSKEVAEHNYHPSHYKGRTEAERGLAETHEQVSDNYAEGTIDQMVDK